MAMSAAVEYCIYYHNGTSVYRKQANVGSCFALSAALHQNQPPPSSFWEIVCLSFFGPEEMENATKQDV